MQLSLFIFWIWKKEVGINWLVSLAGYGVEGLLGCVCVGEGGAGCVQVKLELMNYICVVPPMRTNVVCVCFRSQFSYLCIDLQLQKKICHAL